MTRKWSEDKKAYQKEYHKKWYETNKEKETLRIRQRRHDIAQWFAEYKSQLKCVECGEDHVACLDFHHLHDKEDCIYKLVVGGCSRERILKEIEKCLVLCSNCHRKLHYMQRGDKS